MSEQQQEQAAPGFRFNKKILFGVFIAFSIAKMFYQPGSTSPYTHNGLKIAQHSPILPPGSSFDLNLYASLTSNPKHLTPKNLVFSKSSVELQQTLSSVNESFTLEIPSAVFTKNATLYAHLILTISDSKKQFNHSTVGHFTSLLPLYTQEERVFLASGSSDNITVLSKELGVHLLPAVTFGIVPDNRYYKLGKIAPQYQGMIRTTPKGDKYFPLLWFHDFWVLPEHCTPLNSLNGTTFDVRVEIVPVALWKFVLMEGVKQQVKIQEQFGLSDLSGGPGILDDIKRILKNTSPILLISTGVVSTAHVFTEMLAFKADLKFWKGKKNLKGMSVRSVLFTTIMSTIQVLYLFDAKATTVILVTSVVGVGIEWFKVFKCFDVYFINFKGVRLPWLKAKPSYNEETRKHDRRGMTLLLCALLPICIGYSGYTFFKHSYKSLYSWIITSLVNLTYALGFSQMFVVVFVNYKLKSVAGISYRTLAYKFCNTIVDDFSVFILPNVPLLYKLAVFRDDVVFVILMIQRVLYPVDKTRMEAAGGEVSVGEHEHQD
ncbi:hypothetical protein RCL1_005228 [Eukaryota sp. TZLM3-RCL]